MKSLQRYPDTRTALCGVRIQDKLFSIMRKNEFDTRKGTVDTRSSAVPFLMSGKGGGMNHGIQSDSFV
jgi:hypothetical protein